MSESKTLTIEEALSKADSLAFAGRLDLAKKPF